MIHTATSGYAKPVLEPAYNLSLAEPKKKRLPVREREPEVFFILNDAVYS